jgi:FAD/FMN-containing dehydrogenase
MTKMAKTLKPLALEGMLIGPDDPRYDDARKVFNGMIDRHPKLIARCAGTTDVRAAIAYARQNGLPLSIRGGGHNVAGNSVVEGGLVIDMSDLREVRVDAARRIATAQPGATWFDFDQATQAHGLATTGGLVSSTGVAGFTLGGGIGWLVRKHGLACDNLIGAELVTADGEVVRTSETENPDLLWGLRGGGGNFGVVTSFELRVHPLVQVMVAFVAHPLERAHDLLRFFREQCARAPDELTLLASFSTTPDGPVVAIGGCYAGPLGDAAKALQPLREFGAPMMEIETVPYTVLQSYGDEAAPWGSLNYWKADFMPELTDQAIDLIVDHANRMPSPLSQVHIHHLGGAVNRIKPDASAFPHRTASFVYNLLGIWSEPSATVENTSWARDAFKAMRAVSTGAAYANFLSDDDTGRVRAAYGSNYTRLAELKRRYDPDNLFRLNLNVKPA